MCTFKFTYTDGNEQRCLHVKSATYTASNRVVVSEQDLMTHAFPMNRILWLFAENGSLCVSSDGLRSIEVTAE